ncbi:MAG TPA: PASTA domain-containing protein [Thermoanaerobaculia bacterium]|nr:PASTA domain-containing protein [Thermoanaerobaculia bacterium]
MGVAGALVLRSNSKPPREVPPIADATDTLGTPPTTTIVKEEPIVMATVPDVTGSAMFVTDAIDWLQGAGFRVDLRPDTSSDAPRGTVVRQVPVAGAPGARGSTVRLTVSDTTNVDLSLSDEEKRRMGDQARGRFDDAFAEAVKVPEFGTLQTDFVDAILQLQRLNLKADLDLPPNHTALLATVYQQNPAGGAQLKSGQAVTIRVGAMAPGPYAVVLSKLNRLTPANQAMVQDFIQRMEKRRGEINGGAGQGKGP